MTNKEFELQHDLVQARERITQYTKSIGDLTQEVFMYRDCNQQMKQEQEEAEWEATMKAIPTISAWAKENRRILNEFEALQDAIRGKQENKNEQR